MSAVIDLTGRRFGHLVVVARFGSTGRGVATWHCECRCGRSSVVRGDALRRGSSGSCGRTGCRWGGPGKASGIAKDAPLPPVESYRATHARVARSNGQASRYACGECRETAAHWSYAGKDPDERRQVSGYGAGLAYSLDSRYYRPLCVPCHASHDAAARRALKEKK